jgi:hypothetical protein
VAGHERIKRREIPGLGIADQTLVYPRLGIEVDVR